MTGIPCLFVLLQKPPLLVQKREAEPEKLPLKAKFVLDHSI